MQGLRMADIASTGDFTSPRRDELSILWAITRVCNYSCSYCVYYKSTRHADFSSREQLLRAARSIVRLARPGYQLTLYGGEPTHHPHFLALLDALATAGAPLALRMYTNGSRTPAFFEKMLATLAGQPFGVIFSLHHEFANFDRFLGNVRLCAEAGLSVGISIMFAPGHRDLARRYVEAMLELRARVPFFVSLNLPYTRDGAMATGCTTEDLAWIEASRAAFAAFDMPDRSWRGPYVSPFYTRIKANITLEREGRRTLLAPEDSLEVLSRLMTPSYREFHCCSGANVWFIEEDGAVRGGVCSASAHMGNIFRDSEIALQQRAAVVQCHSVTCGSIENIPLPKFRDRAEAEACMQGFQRRARAYFYQAEAARLAAD